MAGDIDRLKSTLRHWTLLLGVLQITVGCIIGFIPPSAVHWFRGIVMAHIEFTANGVLMTVAGLLIPELRLPRLLLHLWFWTLLIGTWANGGAGVVAAFTGRSTTLLPTANKEFPPPLGVDNPFATALLLVTGLAIVVALLLTLVGLIRSRNTRAA